jgi:outer membrane biosynthesis protein TonB
MKKSRLIALLAVVFIAAGAGTVFVLTQLKKPAADEPKNGEPTTAVEEPTEQPAEEKKDEEKKAEEPQEPVDPVAAMKEKEKQEIALMKACNKLSDDMNKELEKEDRRYGNDLQTAYQKCGGGKCEEVDKENKKHDDNRKTIRAKYEKKFQSTKCRGSL